MSKKPVLMPKAERREAALVVALKLAKKVGARRVSMAMVAAAQKVTAPLLFHIFESREGLTKAILKAAKAQGVVLPEAAPTVREARAATKKPLKALKPLAVPAKGAKPAKLGKLIKPKAPVKKVAALLRPKLPINVVKAIKNKEAAKGVDGIKLNAKFSLPKPATKKAATVKLAAPAGQRAAKKARDAARRAPAVVSTPASKFASLPAPFEAALAQVGA
jgi:AcrR family transcriptional regulator